MAQTIIIKNGTGTPGNGNVVKGELALNTDSGSLYYGDTNGNVQLLVDKNVFIQMSCTDETTNINAASAEIVDFSVVDVVSSASDFSNSSGEVTVNVAGVYEIYFTIIMYSLVVRANPWIRVNHNGYMTDITGGTYIRNASGHRRSNSQSTGLLTIAAGDTINVKSMYSSAWGASGDVTMKDGTKLIIRKIG